MKKVEYHLEHYNTIPKEYEEILYQEISHHAFEKKGLPEMTSFSIFVKNQEGSVLGGITGTFLFGSLYIDSLWVDKSVRSLGWGTKLMEEAEKKAKEHPVRFITLNTMDWQALGFYQKLGFAVEFIREGYEKESKMFLLRKDL